MANVDRPNGFQPVKYVDGSPYYSRIIKAYSPTDNLFKGDLVEMDTAGQADGDGVYPTVDRVDAAGDLIWGVVVGWEANPTDLGKLYHVASTTYAVYVVPAHGLVMEAQDDAATMVAGDVGLNISPTTTAGDTTTGASNMELSGSTAATTASLTLRIIGAVDRPDNEVGSANARYLVTVNKSAWADGSVGV